MPNTESRVHYSVDGSKVYRWFESGTREELSLASKQVLEMSPPATANELTDFNKFAINFPVPTKIKKIGLKYSTGYYMAGFDVFVSNDSTDGSDGTWTNVLALTSPPPSQVYTEYGVLEIEATWIKIVRRDNHTSSMWSFYCFGEYAQPRFEFWNEAGTEELSGNYPLTFPNASNLNDYTQVKKFRVKNTHSIPHTYSLTITPIRQGGDLTITNNLKLSLDDGATKWNTVTTAEVAAGGLSEVVSLYADIVRADNPADGNHYWYVDGMEVT